MFKILIFLVKLFEIIEFFLENKIKITLFPYDINFIEV